MNPLDWDIRLLLHFDQASPADWVDTSMTPAIRMQLAGDGVGVAAEASSRFGANCYSYAGGGSYQGVSLSPNHMPLPGAGPYSLAMWVFMAANQSATKYLFRLVPDDLVGTMHLAVSSAGLVTYQMGVALTMTSSSSLPVGQWNLVEVSRGLDGTTRLFINGVVVASSSTYVNAGTKFSTGGTIGTGAAFSGTNFVGKIDEVVFIVGQPWHTADYSTSLPTEAFADPVRAVPVLSPAEARLTAAWPAGPLALHPANADVRYDPVDSGPLSIAGTVKIDDDPDIPVVRRVRLFEKATGRLVRETWSAADGSYSFTGIKDNNYFLVAHDHTLNDNAAVKDEIRPQAPA